MFYGQPDGSGLDRRDDSEEIARAISASANGSGSSPGSAFPGFDGDFYRDPDDVTRGLSINPAEAPHFVDFYREPDELYKGASLGAAGSKLGLPFLEGDPKAAAFDNLLSTEYLKDAMTNKKRFEKTNKPPPLPTDTFFSLELTTLHAAGEPDVIGNHLLDFLCKEVVSSITKVNQKKFSIKADVFVDNVMCTLKIRLYDFCDPRGFAVEFQRRSGNAVTYNVVFQKACQYLKAVNQKGMMVTGGLEASPTIAMPLPPLPMEFVTHEVDLAPLFDMAGMVDIPTLQAEAASSLAKAAEDRLLDPHLCKGETFLAIQNLWQAQELEVAFPTSRLVGHLAEKDEAAQFFDANVLAQIIDRVRRNPEVLVQQELAKALNNALQRKIATGDALQDGQIAALKPSVSDALQEQGAGNPMILQNLEAAQRSLNSFSQGCDT